MTLAIASQGDNNTCNQIFTCQTTSSNDTTNLIITIIGGVIASVTGIILTPILNEQFKIRDAYFGKYTKWCIEFSGIFHEFREICSKIRKEESKFPGHEKMAEFGQTDILSHLWQMHDEVENGVKWIGMVKKDYKLAGDALDEIFDGVDRLWHKLENDYYQYLLGKSTTPSDFKAILFEIKKDGKLDEIVDLVKEEIKKPTQEEIKPDYFKKENFECVEYYLVKKTPKELNPIRRMWLFLKSQRIV